MGKLIKLKDGNYENPIIFIHPIGGNLFPYKKIVDNLKTSKAIYGIQDELSSERYQAYQTLGDQAQNYIQLIFDEISPNKLAFAGLSSGGTIGYEMAYQCLMLGIHVEKVIMFDTWIKAPFDFQFKQYFNKIITRQANKLEAAEILDNPTTKENWLNQLWERMKLVMSYTPPISNNPIIVFAAKECTEEYYVKPENYAWEKVTNSSKVFKVSGNHETLLDAPHDKKITDEINKILT